MKRPLVLALLLLIAQSVCFSQSRDVIVVLANGKNLPEGTALSPIVDPFIDALTQSTDNKYSIVDRSDDFTQFIDFELSYQSTGMIDETQMAKIGKRLGAKLVCGLVVEKSFTEQDYYFRARIISVEDAEIKGNAYYPNEIYGERKVTSLRRAELQRVALYLIRNINFMTEEQKGKWQEKIDLYENTIEKEFEKEMAMAQEKERLEQEKQIKLREIEIRETAKEREKEARRLDRQQSWESFTKKTGDFMRPHYAWHFMPGGSATGFQLFTQFDIKYISLGVGVELRDKKGISLPTDTKIGLEPKYYLKRASFLFSAGLNFKYFGFAIKPELMSYSDNSNNWNRNDYYGAGKDVYDNDKYINANIKKTVLAYTPVFYIHVPFRSSVNFDYDSPNFGLIASVGYKFIPDLKANTGFEFNVGFSWFW